MSRIIANTLSKSILTTVTQIRLFVNYFLISKASFTKVCQGQRLFTRLILTLLNTLPKTVSITVIDLKLFLKLFP